MKWMPSVLCALLCIATVTAGQSAPDARGQDNRRSAGTRDGAIVRLKLAVREAVWRPELQGPAFRVPAFAVDGAEPQIPGPMLRLRQGDQVEVSVRSDLSIPVTVYGFTDHTRPDEGLTIAPGQQTQVGFRAREAGSYFYWARTVAKSQGERNGVDAQLNGAIIVDAPGSPAADRVFILTRYSRPSDPNAVPPDPGGDVFAINGRSWPDTERLAYDVGQRVRWRWINASDEHHPLHLHGQYFQVVRTGDNSQTAPIADPPLVVTEALAPGHTMDLEWTARDVGRWLFHCHVLFHVAPELRVPAPDWIHEHAQLTGLQHMAGLVLGIDVRGRTTATTTATASRRRLTLTAGERNGVRFTMPALDVPGLGYALGEDSGPTATVTAPGPVLVLRRGQPVDITIRNDLARATAVHWHGIELDSYFDGVAGFGGVRSEVTPSIAPGQSFVARFTPPRSGTFIYHTHFNDYIQLSTGLYGALIVADESRPFDPEHDKVFVFSRDGPDDEHDDVLINGAVRSSPMVLRRGETYRFRMIGILPAPSPEVSLLEGDSGATLVSWRAVAKDGADLPVSRRLTQPARLEIYPGETYDFEFTPEKPGRLRLEASVPYFKKLAVVPIEVQ